MNKITFKNEMLKNGFECLQFGNDCMVYKYLYIMVEFYETENGKYNVCICDDKTMQMWELLNVKLCMGIIDKIMDIIINIMYINGLFK